MKLFVEDMGCLKIVVLLSVLLIGGTCIDPDTTTVGELPGDVVAELIDILVGGLELIGQCDQPQFNDINLLLYTRNNPDNPISINASNPEEVDPNKNTILLIHGWISGPTAEGIVALREAYLERYDCNLIIVDWSILAAQLYTTSYCELPGVAALVGNFLCLLSAQLNIPLSTIHLVGHSLGGQMSGLIGQYTYATCGQRIGRITGMDPAGPLYQGLPIADRLDSTDAMLVDVIHSNEGVFGYWGNCGHMDFHANCGTQQPGCANIDLGDIENTLVSIVSCSHSRSMLYMAESVNSDNFKAKSCASCPTVCIADIINPVYVTMGEDCPHNSPKSKFKIPTNGSPPYAKGCAPYSGCS